MDCSLYIHIPFCRTKCDYCDFFSVPCGNQSVSDFYVESLCNEIAFRAKCYNIESFSTVYVGGGTPSILSDLQLKKIMQTVFSLSKQKPLEISIEVNPDDVTEELLKSIRDAGFNRLSCGLQAFDQGVLKAVNRRSSLETVRKAVKLIREHWKGIFSADVIAALPGQTEEVFLNGLSELIEASPHHISMYSLTVEDETPLGKRFLAENEEYDYEAADEMWLKGRVFLEQHGYSQYEVSNFSKPGFECKHNMVYWKLEDYIGCGSGATGTLYKKGLRFTNTKNIAEYVDFWKNPSELSLAPGISEEIDFEIQQFEFFMMGLRTLKGVCKETFEERFNKTFPEKAVQLFEKWQAEGKAFIKTENGKNWYGLNKKGILFLNAFLKDLL